MGAKVSISNHLAAICHRMLEYFSSEFSFGSPEYDEELMKTDWFELGSVLFPEDVPDLDNAFKAGINKNNDLAESLQWIEDYIISGYDKCKLDIFYVLSLNKCAIITKIYESYEKDHSPIELLSYKTRMIYNKVILNQVRKKDEHNEVTAEVVFEDKYSCEKIRELLKTWDPLRAQFSTYIHTNMSYRKGSVTKKADKQIRIEDISPDELRKLSYSREVVIDIDLCQDILNGLLILGNIRPHKKLFFLYTNTDYLINENIDAEGFYMGNFYRKLSDIYKDIKQNEKFWEIRDLLNDFHKTTLILPVCKVYKSRRPEDLMIKEQAADTLIMDTLVELYFKDCVEGRRVNYAKVGQRLASWNLLIKNVIRNNAG